MKTNKSIFVTFLILFFSVNSHVFAQNRSPYNIGDNFYPHGYMGCTENISVNPAYSTTYHSAPQCFKIEYQSSTCSNKWAGAYWLNEENNWGQRPGIDFSKRGFTKVTFWAKGTTGKETITFGSGGIVQSQYKDSYKKYSKVFTLTNQWKQYSIDISGAGLSSVIGGFYWSVDWQANTSGVIFYLDDIQFE